MVLPKIFEKIKSVTHPFRCRDAKGHLKEIYTHFTCATDTTNIQVKINFHNFNEILIDLKLLKSNANHKAVAHYGIRIVNRIRLLGF